MLRITAAGGWGWVAAVWGYAPFWFLAEDRVKLAVYRWLDHPPHPARVTAEWFASGAPVCRPAPPWRGRPVYAVQ
ncbi:hypothetical protein [Streptomyces panaciradicis]|uniref:hypothetical protein n=1 Tax=Streptomyces panaciradicis TaxID=1470261 RepID=UPI00201CCC26|nr:hypothetical protein [Streptomyces panaciradicis]MCL6675117.1 hypothetical protein [Streptomyces panaciradicis]